MNESEKCSKDSTKPSISNSDYEPKIDPLDLAFEIEGISPWRKRLSGIIVNGWFGFVSFGARRWLSVINVINLWFVFLAFASPLADSAGWGWLSSKVFGFCGLVCVQNPGHSFFIEGHQMALCQRCLAIYAMLGLVGLVFHLVRYKLKPLKFWHYGLLCFPIALDALTQLFGWRQSNWELRLITGGLFGFGSVWYMFPQIELWMRFLNKWVQYQKIPVTGEAFHE